MKIIKRDLPKTLEEVVIYPFADWHLSDGECNLDYIKGLINKVKENPNAYCILNGDLLNMALKDAVSDIYEADMSPRGQVMKAYELLLPIKDRILAGIEGNHEKRVKDRVGISVTEYLMTKLGLEDLYCPISAYIFLRFGENEKKRKICYTIYAMHGSGGGRREGGKVNKAVDMALNVDADIHIHSHTHFPFNGKIGYYRSDPQNSTVNFCTKLFVNTSAALNFGGYGEAHGYKPSALANPRIWLSGKVKDFESTI